MAKEARQMENSDILDEDTLIHYGMPRRSGRYPWGSGEDPYQHGNDFLGRVEEMRKQGFTYTDEAGKTYTGDTAIAKSLGLTTGQFRTEIGIAKDERDLLNVYTARRLKEKEGLGATEIGRKMGVNESTVRGWLNKSPESEARMTKAKETAKFIKEQVDKKGMIDIGGQTNLELNISKEQLNKALYLLEREGYPIYNGRVEQVTNRGNWTTQKVLCKPGTEHKDIYNLENIGTLKEYISRDDGNTFEKKFTYPASMDSKRMKVRYAEEGGLDRDGLVELRRGVDDLSLGKSRYSQVRILVDGTHYIKGMAVYSDDMPDGVDVIFNTNKTKGTPLKKVLKEIKTDDPENPFGSAIKDAEQGGQYWYTDKKTGEKKLGLINKRDDEGDWTNWKDALPSQFLSKQTPELAKKQLNLAVADKAAEFEEICSYNNPTIKKHLLNKFADECDSAAVHLQAAALPGQKYHVIIPINTMKDNEIYAPKYKDGTKLALVRYPHGGTFEIPILTVNNKQPQAKKVLGPDVDDAVGINKKVADRLSGADFDGDTVMCIPTHNGKVKIQSRDPLKGLEGFDPKESYPERKGMRYMKNPVTGKDSTQLEMGKISNLITDMTLRGASDDDLAAAVRHSMVVIDAGKHKLDYKQSEIDNNIAALHKKYQGHYDENGKYHSSGAATLISRASGDQTVVKRQGTPKVNLKDKEWYDPTKPEGSLIYKEADDAYYQVTKTNKRTGETSTITKVRNQKSTKMAETEDARSLISVGDTPMERLYAEYANSMKDMARKARIEVNNTGKIAYDKTAKATYKKEVDSLEDKLNTALLNRPRERQAQRLAKIEVENIKKSYEETHNGTKMKNEDVKKASQRAIAKYRSEVGSVTRKKRNIEITDKEWEAIQKGAISEQKLKNILDNTDISALKQRVMPRATTALTPAQISRIKAMSGSYTIAQIAEAMGKSPSTISKALKGKN